MKSAERYSPQVESAQVRMARIYNHQPPVDLWGRQATRFSLGPERGPDENGPSSSATFGLVVTCQVVGLAYKGPRVPKFQ